MRRALLASFPHACGLIRSMWPKQPRGIVLDAAAWRTDAGKNRRWESTAPGSSGRWRRFRLGWLIWSYIRHSFHGPIATHEHHDNAT